MAEDQELFRTIAACRSCGARELIDVISLGRLFVSNFVECANFPERRACVPLELALCSAYRGGCGLLQLRHTVSPTLLYRNYWYRSGVNQTMTSHLQSVAAAAEALRPLRAGDIVLDIGANDGTLLRAYRRAGVVRAGFEPAENLVTYAREGTSKIFNNLFSAGPFLAEFGERKTRIITAVAMFYDLDDPNSFLSDVVRILDRDGLFLVEMHYLPNILLRNAFDAICHEHLEYYSLKSLARLLGRYNLEIFDVELNNVNGGSFRVYIRHRGSSLGKDRPGASERLAELWTFEDNLKLDSAEIYENFSRRVGRICEKLRSFIALARVQDRKIYAYGASTKGNTLLQFCGLDNKLIFAVADRNPAKWGKRTVATMIPVISEIQARREFPDYFLVLPWHFMPEFKKREEPYLRSGGKFLVPLPEPKIVSRDGDFWLS